MENFFSHKQNKMSGEMGALDCRHLKLPQVTPESLGKDITRYVQDISHDEWMSLAGNNAGLEDVMLLFDMCCAVIGEIRALVLEAVQPQVLALGHCSVMEEDIQACFEDNLYDYFVEVLDVAQESFYKLDRLVRLFSAEITKMVNSSLAQITGSALSSDICDLPTAECISQMVCDIRNIFKNILEDRKRMKDGSCDNLPCPQNVEQDSAEILEISNCLSESSACMDSLTPEPAPQLSDCTESQFSLHSEQMDSSSSRPPSPDYLINQTFLTVLLGKLVDHIAVKTRTSVLNVDLDQLLSGVTVRTEGLLNLAPPQNIDNLHVPIYKELCQQFKSKYVLQAVMESGDEAFEFAVSETLMSQLRKPKTSKKRRNYFKVRKVSPGPEIEEAEPHSGQRSQQTAPSPSKTSLGRTLRKKFSRWASNVVNFLK